MKGKHFGFLLGGIIPGAVAFVLAIIGTVFRILGTVFVNHPDEVKVTINGKRLHGEEAVEAAERLGSIFSNIGSGLLITGCILALVCLIMIIIFFVKRSKE